MRSENVTERVVADRYRLHTLLGRGGMGRVWRACDQRLDRDVAVKEVELPPTVDDDERQAMRARVMREARAAGRLHHPNSVTIFDVLEDEQGRIYLIMELVTARTLADRVEQDGPLSPDAAARLGLGLLNALEEAHRRGIVDRDIKPANVMAVDGSGAKLADFGIASLKGDPRITSTGLVFGSPSYMSPEQARGLPSGPLTDMWGLGATLYFAVEGEPPFGTAEPIATLNAVVHNEPRPFRRAGPLAPVIASLLAKSPEDRLPPEEVRRRLELIAGVRLGSEVTDPDLAPAPVEADEEPAVGEPAVGEAVPVEAVPGEAPAPEPAASEPSSPEPVERVPPAEEALAPVPAVTVAEPPAAAEEPVVEAEEPVPAEPVTTRVPEPEEDAGVIEPRRRRRWPPVAAAVLVLGALALVAGRSQVSDDTPGRVPQAPSTSATTAPSGAPAASGTPTVAVPRDWVQYRDQATGYSISHPPAWQIRRVDATRTDFRDPASATYLRVDWRRPPGRSAVDDWLNQAKSFAAEHPGYRQIRIEPTSYKGFVAAVWEFTYPAGNTRLRALDLGFITGDYGFALYFQTREQDWARSQPTFEAFKASFSPPA